MCTRPQQQVAGVEISCTQRAPCRSILLFTGVSMLQSRLNQASSDQGGRHPMMQNSSISLNSIDNGAAV